MAIFTDKKKAKKVKEHTSVRHARTTVSLHGAAHDVLRAPWFSEKALIMTEKGVYAFAVSPRATKSSIAGAIKEIYNVSPKSIRIVNLPAKSKSMRTRRGVGTRAARCKAYVYLNAGDSIQFA
ncbi:MAG TPA: 50S ribosomal protein L23 [Candidatus Paceibacterota bacterium]|nr:50S ribosomal protein L23 [Candidatus Paceibacterota bacterium]